MRIAAWALTIFSALACAWLVAVAAMLIAPGGDGTVLHDSYYEIAAARSSLLPAFLALLNGVGTLLLYRQRRPGSLWIVLGAGLLALAVALWHILAIHAPAATRIPHDMDAWVAAAQRNAYFRWLLAWAALGFSVVGWAAWAVCRRVEIGHGRD